MSAARARGLLVQLWCSPETSSLSSPRLLGVPNNKPAMEKEGNEAQKGKKGEVLAGGGMVVRLEHSQLEVNLLFIVVLKDRMST